MGGGKQPEIILSAALFIVLLELLLPNAVHSEWEPCEEKSVTWETIMMMKYNFNTHYSAIL